MINNLMNSKFDILQFYKERGYLSYSAINSFTTSYSRTMTAPEQWYQSYILNKRQTSKELEFGSYVDKALQNDPTFLPQVERFPIMQHEMKIVFDGIPLGGLADAYHPEAKILADYKTGKTPWTQKKANESDQLTMYALLLYLTAQVKPSDMEFRIVWLPTQEQGDFTIGFRDDPVVPHVFHTKRSMLDILEFGKHIKATLEEMEKYVNERTF